MRRTIGVLVKEGSGAWPPPASVAGRVNFYRGGDAASLQAQTDTLDALVWVPGVAGAEATKAFEALGPNWVHSFSAGVDGLAPFLASEALAARPTPLSNGRGAFSSSLAEYVLAAALHFNKQLPRCARNRDAKRWDAFTMDVLAGKTMGFVGWGHIAKTSARLAEAFGMKTIACRRDPGKADADGEPAPGATFGVEDKLEVFKRSDFVVCSLPGTQATRDFCGGPEFAAMKNTAVFISLGRGAADEGALVLLTAHNADLTADYFELGWDVFAANLDAWEGGADLATPFDPALGY
ncbi:phosphoglycerate dehydrogenase [Aureococcus anophagefferens]|nr:phosphoglycerate dehydrogenase [Aureococcus anophagefferens]